MTWQELENQLEEVAQKISDFSPDSIIGIVRGGIIPARLLSTYLNVKHIYCLNVVKKDASRIVETEITIDLSGKKILLIEDMLETGQSLIVAKKYLEEKGATVKTACLYIMPISKIKPDYYLKSVEQLETFPWE